MTPTTIAFLTAAGTFAVQTLTILGVAVRYGHERGAQQEINKHVLEELKTQRARGDETIVVQARTVAQLTALEHRVYQLEQKK